MSFKWCNTQAGHKDLWSQGAGARESHQGSHRRKKHPRWGTLEQDSMVGLSAETT